MDGKFKKFVELFANYPTVQDRLSILEKSGTQSGEPLLRGMIAVHSILTLFLSGGPPRSGPIPNGGHRPSHSGEDGRRVPRPSRGPHPRRNGPSEELDIFASPDKQRESRRARRNSESSILEKSSLTEAERKRRQMRHREREARSRDSRVSNSSKTREGDKKGDSKEKDPKDPSKRRRKPRGMDLIDQLDQTGIYGAGCKLITFHIFSPFSKLRHISTGR